MNADAIVLAMLAITDLAVLNHLRQRNALREREERLRASLNYAVHCANSEEEISEQPQLEQAG